MSASNQKSYLRDGNNPRAVDGSREKSRSSGKRDDDKSGTRPKHSSSSGRRLSESRTSHHGRKPSTASPSDRPALELDVIGQPARSIVLGQTVETSVMVSLRCPSAEMAAQCRDTDTGRLIGLVSLVADARGGERVPVECGTLTGQKLFDSVHDDLPDHLAHSLARTHPCRRALGSFTFPHLLIRQPGTYRLRATLIKQSSSSSSSSSSSAASSAVVVATDTDSIRVERRAPAAAAAPAPASTGRKHARS